MGRKRKFGEESAWVSVRVPMSKVREYRTAVREFVEAKYTMEIQIGQKSACIMIQVPRSQVKEVKKKIRECVKSIFVMNVGEFQNEKTGEDTPESQTKFQDLQKYKRNMRGKEKAGEEE